MDSVKELESTHEQLNEPQDQISHDNGQGSTVIGDSRDFRERAEAAEVAVCFLKAEVENLREENRVLKVLLDVYSCDEPEYPIPPPERQDEPKLPKFDLENKVKKLEENLKTYYKQYKVPKETREVLRNLFTELPPRVLGEIQTRLLQELETFIFAEFETQGKAFIEQNKDAWVANASDDSEDY
ncbi:hypothetical protein BYT27DRAFT_7258841 [Phlegmacium glaucopus]|nr:hypothetical protein BYT27DRAFT_7258841 [Phlegmacium glaucopus]